MNVQIRYGVFETNSSSMHSVAIGKGDYIEPGSYICKDGVIKVDDNTYGWGYEELHSMLDKALYLVTDYVAQNQKDPTEFLEKEIYPIFKKYYTGFDMFEFRPVSEHDYDDLERYGLIDHQSIGNISSWLENYEVTIEEFLTNSKYYIIIDNDNEPHMDYYEY